MTLTEALKTLQRAPVGAGPFPVLLACGFSPLHLKTFLTAHLQQGIPDRVAQVETGLYGNLVGTIEGAHNTDVQAIAIALEWTDLDARLGYRQTGGWGATDLADIVANSEGMLRRLESAVRRVPESVKLAISLPTLPLPPAFFTPSWQSSEAELRLHRAATDFAANLARVSNVAFTSRQSLDEASNPATRFDLKNEIQIGFPYTMQHAQFVARSLAQLIRPFVPKKGLVTDLDDTMWKGIVGEVGAAKVGWDMDSHSQIHGLYQQVLRALAQQGVLLAVASKNDPDVAKKALERSDMLISQDKMFPLEIHWNAKSGSVERIAKTWNIGLDSVVFVDDSPMELAEVKAAHPAVECLQFPKEDYAAARAFLQKLRDLFGKTSVTAEDALRLESIRQGAELRQMMEDGGAPPEAFLAEMKAKVTFDFAGALQDPRTIELVNKTNQFNLNGRRFTAGDWNKAFGDQNTFVASMAYEDKFGPLGKIAVVGGQKEGRTLHISAWVMSCRAFARRIEHQCLKTLFDRFDADEVRFDYEKTAKNGPVESFLGEIACKNGSAPVCLKRSDFQSKCPTLYHSVVIN